MRYIVDPIPQTGPSVADFIYPIDQLGVNSHLRPRSTNQPTLTRQRYQPQLVNAKLMSSGADDTEPTDKRSITSGSGSPARASVGFFTKYTNAIPYIKKADTKENFFMHFGRK